MVRILGIASLALAVVSAVSGHVIRHRGVPDGWNTPILEDYGVYHKRYLSLGCDKQHDTPFFQVCCHPLLRNESISVLYDLKCFSPDNWDCVDESSSVPHPTPFLSTSPDYYTPTSSPPVGPTSSAEQDKPSPSPTVSSTPSPEAAKFVEHSSAESTSTPAEASPSPSPTSTGSSDGGGDWTYGGFATFFYQNNNAGACGDVHRDSDFVAALDSATYNQGLCGRQVEIVNLANGKSVKVTVADACPTCDNEQSIDLSVAAFEQLADLGVGTFAIKSRFA